MALLTAGWVRHVVLGLNAAGFCLAFASHPAAQNTGTPSGTIRTPIPRLLEDWVVATAGPKKTLDDARKIAEGCRPQLPKRDPFTPLVEMTCAQRLALPQPERVVWEDHALMALVDFGNRGSKLLVVPKTTANFPIDLSNGQIAYLNRVAAATCDALVLASGGQPTTDTPSCKIEINSPCRLGVRQLHVHVEARTGVAAPVDDTFLQRTGTHLRSLVGGTGCF